MRDRWLFNPHVQTIAGAYLPHPSHNVTPFTTRIDVALADGDRLACWEASTQRDCSSAVLLVHGLGGSSDSPYIRRVAQRLLHTGHRVIAMNMRGCGASRCKHLGHSGRSEDLKAVVDACRQRFPDSGITCVGFSMGGNIALKYAAALESPQEIDRVMAICPPADLAASALKIHRGRFRIYERHLLKALKKMAIQRLGAFPDATSAPMVLTSLRDFDHHYTAPLSGFSGVDDYYARSSAAPLLQHISVPVSILSADDDPFVDNSFLDSVPLPTHLALTRLRHGGHMGFLEGSLFKQQRQMDAWIISQLDHFPAVKREGRGAWANSG